MEFTGQRNQEQLVEESEFPLKSSKLKSIDEFLVKSKQPLSSKLFAFFLNIILWFYMAVIFYFFISALFDYNDYYIGLLKISFNMSNHDIRMFLLKALIYFGMFFLTLNLWKYYNKIKFGNLNRRTMPIDTTDEDMLGLKLLDAETYELLKTNKVIIFEKNPIKELERGIRR